MLYSANFSKLGGILESRSLLSCEFSRSKFFLNAAHTFYFTLRVQIRNIPSVYRAYLNYRGGLEKKCDFKSQVCPAVLCLVCPAVHLHVSAYPAGPLPRSWRQGKGPGNEIRRFHGTMLGPECR